MCLLMHTSVYMGKKILLYIYEGLKISGNQFSNSMKLNLGIELSMSVLAASFLYPLNHFGDPSSSDFHLEGHPVIVGNISFQ